MGFQAGTPDFSGKLAKPVLVRVVAKQLFYGTGTPLAEIPGLHSQNMRDKPCRIVSAAGNFACDLFRQNFRGFRLTTPLFASHTRSSTSMRSWRGWNWGDGNFGGSGLQPHNWRKWRLGHQNARNGSGCGRAKTGRIFVANFQAKNGTERGGMGRVSAFGAPRPRLGAIFPG